MIQSITPTILTEEQPFFVSVGAKEYNPVQTLYKENLMPSSIIENYKKGTIPNYVDFSNQEWINAIQADINQLNSNIKSLIKTDSIIGGCSALLLFFYPSISIAATAAYLLFYRNETKKTIEKQIEKLGQLFMKITPKDTNYQIVLNLTDTLAPLISDEKILKSWIRSDFPQQSIDIANSQFQSILANKGFLQVQNFDSSDAAKKAFEQSQTEYQTSLNKTIDLLKGKLRCTLYGKGKVSDLVSTSKLQEYYVRGYMTIGLGHHPGDPSVTYGPHVNNQADFTLRA